MAQTKINFTDASLKKLKHDGSVKRLYFYDKTEPGLALQITPAGTKSFQLQHWDKDRGKSVVKTIGRYPNMSIENARKRVQKLKGEIWDGKDIVEASRALREEEKISQSNQR